MKIKELYLKNFGKFSNQRFFLKEGVQVFYGENEYGKSTIYAFLKAMLFGLERGRGKAARNDEFSRYQPWENPNYFAGVLRFSCGDRNFRLERTFDKYGKQASLICEDDGEELSVEDGDLEVLLGGMTADSFENTAAIGRLSAKPGEELAEELKNYAANYCETGSSELDLQDALEFLKERKKTFAKEGQAIREKRRRSLEQLELEDRILEGEQQRLEEEMQETRALRQQLEAQEETEIAQPKKRKGLFYLASVLVLFAAAAAAGVGMFFYRAIWLYAAAGGLFLGAGVVIGINIYRNKKVSNNTKKERGGEADQEESEEHLRWRSQRLESERKEKQVQRDNLREQMEELQEPTDQLRELAKKEQAVELAMEQLQYISKELVQGFRPKVNERASQILSEVTRGKYEKLLVDEQLQMAVLDEGRKISASRLSRGTVEQIYFALRMAVLELLYEEEFPVIFDDAFAFYDEKRLKSTLKWLSSQSRQVIIFSCQKRELELMQDISEG